MYMFIPATLHLKIVDVYTCFVSDCSEVECERGARCQVVPSTGQPYCYPTCQVDNGGCRGTCREAQPFCIATDEPCQNFLSCVPPGIIHGMAELILQINIHSTRACPFVDTHTPCMKAHVHVHVCNGFELPTFIITFFVLLVLM